MMSAKNDMKENIIEKKKSDWYAIIGSLVIIGALIVVSMISVMSEVSMNPDEWDVKECLEWGMTHWIWPDMRAEDLSSTYSWYGYTKVCNYTPYFLIAGKIAYVTKPVIEGIHESLPWFRFPNLCLMFMMSIIIIKGLKEKKYLLLGFGVCAQAWYIFGYVTADALDFVWAFVSIYLLADDDSFLWKTIKKDSLSVISCVVLGMLYGFMLLGKPYYYANMVLTFIVLLIHLVKSSFEERKTLWIRYLVIVFACGLMFVGRWGIDRYYYGSEKAQIKEEMMEIYASDDKKPSATPDEQDVTYHMASKGYSVVELFKYDEHWLAKSYRSFVSARVTIDEDNWYYLIIGVLYFGIYIWIGLEMLGVTGKARAANLKSENTIIFIGATLLNIGGVVASIMNSYLIDSQAQGRYLLPIALTTCYLGSRVPCLWKNKHFKLLVLTTSAISIMYFGLFDSRKLIDVSYVLQTYGG